MWYDIVEWFSASQAEKNEANLELTETYVHLRLAPKANQSPYIPMLKW